MNCPCPVSTKELCALCVCIGVHFVCALGCCACPAVYVCPVGYVCEVLLWTDSIIFDFYIYALPFDGHIGAVLLLSDILHVRDILSHSCGRLLHQLSGERLTLQVQVIPQVVPLQGLCRQVSLRAIWARPDHMALLSTPKTYQGISSDKYGVIKVVHPEAKSHVEPFLIIIKDHRHLSSEGRNVAQRRGLGPEKN